MMQKISITTTQKREVVDLTKIINDLLSKNSYYEGICFMFCTHTSCALTMADLDAGGTNEDYVNAYEALMPKIPYKHPHDPSHFPDHLMSATIGTSLFVPVQSASMTLGLNQKLILVEFSGPRERRIILNFIKEDLKSAF